MLDDDQQQLLITAYELRQAEADADLWFAPTADKFVTAVALWERRYLDRRWHGDDLVYRIADQVTAALDANALMSLADGRQN